MCHLRIGSYIDCKRIFTLRNLSLLPRRTIMEGNAFDSFHICLVGSTAGILCLKFCHLFHWLMSTLRNGLPEDIRSILPLSQMFWEYKDATLVVGLRQIMVGCKKYRGKANKSKRNL